MAAKLSTVITRDLFNLWSKMKFESTCLLGQAPPNPSVVPAFEFQRRPGCASLRTSGAGALLSNTARRPAETARSNSQASLVVVLALHVAVFFMFCIFLFSRHSSNPTSNCLRTGACGDVVDGAIDNHIVESTSGLVSSWFVFRISWVMSSMRSDADGSISFRTWKCSLNLLQFLEQKGRNCNYLGGNWR